MKLDQDLEGGKTSSHQHLKPRKEERREGDEDPRIYLAQHGLDRFDSCLMLTFIPLVIAPGPAEDRLDIVLVDV